MFATCRTYTLLGQLKLIRATFYVLLPYAVVVLQVKPEKVNAIIGSGGKKVKSIIEETGVEAIDTQDDGTVRSDDDPIYGFYFFVCLLC